MKVFISADIEGITGVTVWDETEQGKAEYDSARQQMTAEVAAACEGALAAGATEIWVKDSHDTGRNLIPGLLPRQARLVRGWSGHPFQMLQELDSSFDAVLLVGYHSGAGWGKSPLEHTMSGNLMSIRLNGASVSEFLMDAHTAAFVKVPLVFVSGDKGLCEVVGQLNPHIRTVAVKEGAGSSTINLHPALAAEKIKEAAAEVLKSDLSRCRLALPAHFKLSLRYRSHARAYQYGFFPGARQVDTFTVEYETDSWFEALRFLMFAV